MIPMSALGQKRTYLEVCPMSALPPIADIGTQSRNVRFVPEADISSACQSRCISPKTGMPITGTHALDRSEVREPASPCRRR
jgi:hypothetical protein